MGTYVISILQRINVTIKETQAIILAPTRELAHQIQKVVLSLGDYMGVCCHACVGGTSFCQEIDTLKSSSPHIIVGTPGRVFDMLMCRVIFPRAIQMLVLDEADWMLGLLSSDGATKRLLREHVSQTRSHPNDDKLALSPPLASQSSPDLDVMHVRLLRTELCGHRTQLSFNGGPDLPVLNHHTLNFFPNKRKKGISTIDQVFDGTETV
ncbi:hypothetical protein fugu_001183 [Takifugu bimaculatus]|uniref:ATP-dependent RNA helicase n=1 Tax=Takifugu bimaculatus TaxID=433685 RepID=A0A4Z2CJ77_9TELE|nr:hypothetical protein fugu_001183 [Takifugu bimaculatus]